MKTVFITGFMAAGKSSVGEAVAKRLGWRFVDLDNRIVERTGKEISELFLEGEAHFRTEERKVLKELLPCHECVIALGGGALTRRDNLDLVQESGVLVYLEVDADTLFERLESGDIERPILENKRGEELREHIKRLLDSRRHYYEAAVVMVRGNRKKSIETIAEELHDELHSRLPSDPD